MEASLSYLKELFALGNTDIKTYSPLTLAYIGDAVYERASKLVKASAQSEIIEKLKEDLTEEELAVYKRGRNAKSYTMAKNATMSDYRRATGFEALMGYLYLTEQWERMLQLIKKGIEKGETDGREVPGK